MDLDYGNLDYFIQRHSLHHLVPSGPRVGTLEAKIQIVGPMAENSDFDSMTIAGGMD